MSTQHDPGPSHSPSHLSAELEAEISAAMSGMSDSGAGRPAPARPGAGHRGPRVVTAGREHRTGLVVSVGPTDIFLEFGPKEIGVAPRAHWPEDQTPKVGEQVPVVIDKYEAAESLFLCSRPGTVQKADWELLEPGQVVAAKVVGVNKGGLDLEVAGHRAFMPASQVSLDRNADLSKFVGEKLTCQVSKVDRAGRGNIVLSRRDLLDAERKEKAAKLKETLAEGQILDGTVRKIMPFGAFVDIGGVDGLVHASDLTFERTPFGEKAVAKYVQEGQAVRVQVLKLDLENDRISLGIKQVQGDPFATALADIADGAEVTGRVVRITEFGAFVEIAPGTDGLVHISELDHRRVARVEDVLKVDEVVKAKVLKVDKDQRRVSLSIKALKPAPEPVIGSGGPGRKGAARGLAGRSAEEILKVSPELRRLREKHKKTEFRGGLG